MEARDLLNSWLSSCAFPNVLRVHPVLESYPYARDSPHAVHDVHMQFAYEESQPGRWRSKLPPWLIVGRSLATPPR